MHLTVLSSTFTFGDQNNPNLPFQSILTSHLPLPALPPLPPAPCARTPGSHGSDELPSCTVSIKHHLWALFFFYERFFYWPGSVFTHDSNSAGVVNCPACTSPYISIQSVSWHGGQRRPQTLYCQRRTNSHLSVLLSVIYCTFSSAEHVWGKNRSLP